MPGDIYTIKVGSNQGTVEVSGPDRDWVEKQVDRLNSIEAAGSAKRSAGGRRKRSPAATSNGGHGSGGSAEAKHRIRRVSGRGSARARRVPELEQKLTKDVRTKLEKWHDEREENFKGLPDQAAIIATFLLDVLKVEEVGPDELYTVYAVMGWPTAGNPKAQLENARHRNKYFGPWESGKVELSHTGERFGRIESKKPVAKKSK